MHYYLLYHYIIYIYLIIYRKAKANRRGKTAERTEQNGREGKTADTLARSFPSVFRLRFLSSFALISSARSLLFVLPSSCSSLSPSCRLTAQPSPAAHPVTPSPKREGVHPVPLWVMSSPPPRHHRAADRQPAGQRLRLPDLLPASPLSSPPGRW